MECHITSLVFCYSQTYQAQVSFRWLSLANQAPFEVGCCLNAVFISSLPSIPNIQPLVEKRRNTKTAEKKHEHSRKETRCQEANRKREPRIQLRRKTKPAENITKTYLYNFDPLKPHFYTVKLGFTGVYIIFLFLLKNIDCGHSLELPTIYVLSRNMKNIRIFIWKLSDFGGESFNIFE